MYDTKDPFEYLRHIRGNSPELCLARDDVHFGTNGFAENAPCDLSHPMGVLTIQTELP